MFYFIIPPGKISKTINSHSPPTGLSTNKSITTTDSFIETRFSLVTLLVAQRCFKILERKTGTCYHGDCKLVVACVVTVC